MPLIESRVPVSSVRRIVVKHSESIEETAALFSRYFKMLFSEPKYSRIALGLPGMLILIWSILAILGQPVYYYAITIVLVLSSFMLIKGFGIDRSAKSFIKWIREYSPPRFASSSRKLCNNRRYFVRRHQHLLRLLNVVGGSYYRKR